MQNATPKQLQKLAYEFLEIASSLTKYIISNKLSKREERQLWELQSKTNRIAYDLAMTSVSIIPKEVVSSLNSLSNVTKEINKTYESIKNINKVINIAAAVIVLGASIFSLDIKAVKTNLDNLFKTLKSFLVRSITFRKSIGYMINNLYVNRLKIFY